MASPSNSHKVVQDLNSRRAKKQVSVFSFASGLNGGLGFGLISPIKFENRMQVYRRVGGPEGQFCVTPAPNRCRLEASGIFFHRHKRSPAHE